jgi:Fe-S cluster assembly iron-binding protein IscA
VLTLTDRAAEVVRAMTHDPRAPEHAGVRLARMADGVEVSLARQPLLGDDVIARDGVRVFVERATSWLLNGHVLDATTEGGLARFSLRHGDVRELGATAGQAAEAAG